MTDYAFFRGRLTGRMVADSTDTDPQPGAVATVTTEDSDVTGSTPIQTLAKIIFPGGAPCPLYAAYFYFFGTVTAPVSIPVALSAMPLVVVRRDITDAAGDQGAQTITISPTFVAKATQLWGAGGTPPLSTYSPNFVQLEFWDYTNSTVGSCLGYFPQLGTTMGLDVIQPATEVLVTTRVPGSQVYGSVPGGHLYTWICSPLNAGTTWPCIVTAGGPGTGPYTVNFYANGPSNAVTETGASVTILQLNSAETVDVGTWLMATRIAGVWYAQPGIFYT